MTGDTLRARDVGSGQIYRLDDTEGMGTTVDFLTGFAVVLGAGLLLTRPWAFAAWLRSKRGRRPGREDADQPEVPPGTQPDR